MNVGVGVGRLQRNTFREPPGHAVERLVAELLRCWAPAPAKEPQQAPADVLVSLGGALAVRVQHAEQPLEGFRG